MAEDKKEIREVDPIDTWPADRTTLDAIFVALKPLDQEARERILRTVAVFYGLDA